MEGLNRSSLIAYLKTRGSSITCSRSVDSSEGSISAFDDECEAGVGDEPDDLTEGSKSSVGDNSRSVDRMENSMSSEDEAGCAADGEPVDHEPWLGSSGMAGGQFGIGLQRSSED